MARGRSAGAAAGLAVLADLAGLVSRTDSGIPMEVMSRRKAGYDSTMNPMQAARISGLRPIRSDREPTGMITIMIRIIMPRM